MGTVLSHDILPDGSVYPVVAVPCCHGFRRDSLLNDAQDCFLKVCPCLVYRLLQKHSLATTNIQSNQNYKNNTKNLPIPRHTHTFLPIYKTMVRSHLDYAIAVRYPYKKHKIAIENVQRRTTKELPGMGDLSYIEKLKLLKLPTLAYRRLRGDMIEVYKIMHEMYDNESAPNLLKWEDVSLRSGNRGYSLKLFTQRPKINLRKNAFPLRVAEPWHSLPNSVIQARSILI